MNSNNVEQIKIECNGETFKRGTYNGISVLIHEKTGFINGTEMCKQFGKRFRKIFENHAWQEYFNEFVKEFSASPEKGEQSKTEFLYQLNKGFSVRENYLRGTYVDPRLINYIAIWASPKYAITVGKIMDSINQKIHNELKIENLEDNPKNAEPILNKTVNQLNEQIQQQTELINSTSSWGVRDDPFTLDIWERNDLDNDVKEYLKAKAKLENYKGFLAKYHPEIKL